MLSRNEKNGYSAWLANIRNFTTIIKISAYPLRVFVIYLRIEYQLFLTVKSCVDYGLLA